MSRKFVPKKKKLQAEKAKENPRKQMLYWITSNPTRFAIVVFVVLAMTFSSILYALSFSGSNNQQPNVYNGINFNYDSSTGFYTFRYHGQDFRSNSVPLQAQGVVFNQTFINAFINSNRVGIARPYSTNTYEGVSAYTLADALTNGANYQVGQGFTNSTPLLNCSVATSSFPVVIFQQANYSASTVPQVDEYPNPYCLIINYDSYTTLFVQKDALMFYGLGILKPLS